MGVLQFKEDMVVLAFGNIWHVKRVSSVVDSTMNNYNIIHKIDYRR